VVGPLLFIILLWSIYRKISQKSDLQHLWETITSLVNSDNKWPVGFLVLLMLVNWGLESKKWQILISTIQPVSFLFAYRAVLSGLAFSFFIPNGIGEYLGRLLYMNEGNRLRAATVSIVGSISQVVITLMAGIAGLLYLRTNVLGNSMKLEGLSVFWLDGLMYAISAVVLVLLLIYFKISWITTWIEKIPFVQKNKFFIEKLEEFHWKELTVIFMLSLCRYLVFIVQYQLILTVFHTGIGWVQGSVITSVLFLVLAIIPTIPLTEWGVRGMASVQLYGLVSTNTVGIVAATTVIWVVNLIVPALAGCLFILGIKLFRNK